VQLNCEQERTIIQVSHDLDLAAEISHRILLFSADGQIAALGPPREVVTPAKIKAVFGVDVEVVVNEESGAPRIFPLRSSRLSR
jgi:iron complex transport system ATP-binding protein